MPWAVSDPSKSSLSNTMNSLIPSSETMLKTADIISNANNLRRLFHYVCNTAWAADRFEAEIRGTTLLLSRWNDDPDLLVSFGRGVGFERATCRYTDDVDDVIRESASHHRVCSYNLGGLQMVVQSEVDAYFCGCDHQQQTAKQTAKQTDEIPSITPEPATPEPDAPKHTRTRTRTRTRTEPLPVPHRKGTTAPSRQRQRLPSFTALTLDDPGDAPSFTPIPTVSTPSHRVTRPSSTITVHHVPVPGSGPNPASSSSSSASLPAGRTHGRSALPTAKCLVEIKTHNGRTPQRSTAEEQLYFACRSQLYSAAHEDGVFSPPVLVSQSLGGRRFSNSSFASASASSFGSSPPKPGRYTPPHLRSPSSSPPKSWSSYGRRNTISSSSSSASFTLSTSPSSIVSSPPSSPTSPCSVSSAETGPHPGPQDMTHLMHRFESENKKPLRQLVILLRMIREKVMAVSAEQDGRRVRVSLVFESRTEKGVRIKLFRGGAEEGGLWP
ncbi:hypothetical protein B0J18DRAFT_441606 [Chaetomium sp. MPI-SDFR-AT-0129]|nr:hypothetical protein B0J18DRAFT_441606 [Chaetomium sp. MPI-SDFR-AT-0129]